jgi:ketosteroid isomerase-like protein
MRLTATIGLTLVLLVPGVTLGQTTAGGDEAAIRRVIQQHDQTRTSGDWKGVANLFAEDGSTLTSSGEWRRGRAEIEKGGATT